MVDYEVTDRDEDHVHLILRGELVGDISSERVKGDLERHYVDDGVVEIRTDLRDVTYLSLEGVAILLELWRESHRRGKRLPVENARGQVREELELTGVLPMLEAG